MKVIDYQLLNEPFEGGIFKKIILFVSIFEGIQIEDAENLSMLDLTKIYRKNKDKAKISTNIVKSFDGYKLNDFYSLPLGVFIDLENYISDDFNKNYHKISATLYSDLTDYQNLNIDEIANNFLNIEINNVHGGVTSYLNFRKYIFDSYSIFTSPPEDLTDEEMEEMNNKTPNKNVGDQWFEMLNILSNKDITKFDNILSINCLLCFNQLSYLMKSDKK